MLLRAVVRQNSVRVRMSRFIRRSRTPARRCPAGGARDRRPTEPEEVPRLATLLHAAKCARVAWPIGIDRQHREHERGTHDENCGFGFARREVHERVRNVPPRGTPVELVEVETTVRTGRAHPDERDPTAFVCARHQLGVAGGRRKRSVPVLRQAVENVVAGDGMRFHIPRARS